MKYYTYVVLFSQLETQKKYFDQTIISFFIHWLDLALTVIAL